MRVYVDASAAAKLVIIEAETDALRRFLDSLSDAVVMSSVLLETEVRRLATANGATQAEATAALTGVDLLAAPRSLFREAGTLPVPGLRSLDALHLATALHNDAGLLVAYDLRLLAAAELFGLPVAAPV